jgi:hypothetical protein
MVPGGVRGMDNRVCVSWSKVFLLQEIPDVVEKLHGKFSVLQSV